MKLIELLGEKYHEGMTLEEVNEALEGIEMPVDQTKELKRLKDAVSKANSEAAEYKRQSRASKTAEENALQDAKDKQAEFESKYNELFKKVQITELSKQFLSLGYDEALATETAEAMINNDTDKVIANQKKMFETKEKQVKASVLGSTPRPGTNTVPTNGGMTREQFNKLSYMERVQLKESDPETYEKFK